jgi:hypothetical protein
MMARAAKNDRIVWGLNNLDVSEAGAPFEPFSAVEALASAPS